MVISNHLIRACRRCYWAKINYKHPSCFNAHLFQPSFSKPSLLLLHKANTVFFCSLTTRSTKAYSTSTSIVNDHETQFFNGPVTTTASITGENTPLSDFVGTTPVKFKPSKMIEGIRQLLKDYSDHIVLVKYGAYYEMYGDQAIEYSKKLNISLGERASSSKSNPAKIEMLKFNEYQSTKYIYLLVMVMNRSVAIFGRPEQGEDGMPDEVESKKSKKLLDRKLLRIISPGTLTDESFLDRQQCNFLMSLCFPKYSKQLYDASPVGMAWVDVSVGTFHYETTSLANLLTDVARIGPSELLLETYMKPLVEKAKKNTELCDLSKHFLINYQQFPHADDFKNYIHMFEDYDPIDRRKNHHIELEGKSKENSAIMGILEYVNTHLPDNQIALQLPQRKRDKKILKIDNVSRASLELLKALRGNEIEGTLYQSIKRTSSVSGTRLLVEWIKEPLIEARIVRDRQQFVTELVNNPQLLNDLQSLLKASNDPERLLHNFSRGQCQITDIHKMAQDLILFEKVKYIIQKNQQLDSKSSLKKSAVNIMSLSILWEKIYKYIDSEPPTKDSIFSQSHTVSASSYTSLQPLDSLGSQEELKTNILQRFNSWLIYPQASQTLTKLHKLLEDWNVEKKQVELTLCSYYDTLNMKASPKYNKFYGYHLQLNARSAADIDRFKKENPKIILNHTKKTLIINHPDWLKLGENLDAVELKIRREERLIIKRLANMILEQRKTIRMNCKLLDEIDVYCSFAQLALEEGLVKPKVNTG